MWHDIIGYMTCDLVYKGYWITTCVFCGPTSIHRSNMIMKWWSQVCKSKMKKLYKDCNLWLVKGIDRMIWIIIYEI